MTLQVTQDLEYGLICIVTESEKDKVGQMYYFDSIQASILKISEHDQGPAHLTERNHPSSLSRHKHHLVG